MEFVWRFPTLVASDSWTRRACTLPANGVSSGKAVPPPYILFVGQTRRSADGGASVGPPTWADGHDERSPPSSAPPPRPVCVCVRARLLRLRWVSVAAYRSPSLIAEAVLSFSRHPCDVARIALIALLAFERPSVGVRSALPEHRWNCFGRFTSRRIIVINKIRFVLPSARPGAVLCAPKRPRPVCGDRDDETTTNTVFRSADRPADTLKVIINPNNGFFFIYHRGFLCAFSPWPCGMQPFFEHIPRFMCRRGNNVFPRKRCAQYPALVLFGLIFSISPTFAPCFKYQTVDVFNDNYRFLAVRGGRTNGVVFISNIIIVICYPSLAESVFRYAWGHDFDPWVPNKIFSWKWSQVFGSSCPTDSITTLVVVTKEASSTPQHTRRLLVSVVWRVWVKENVNPNIFFYS